MRNALIIQKVLEMIFKRQILNFRFASSLLRNFNFIKIVLEILVIMENVLHKLNLS